MSEVQSEPVYPCPTVCLSVCAEQTELVQLILPLLLLLGKQGNVGPKSELLIIETGQLMSLARERERVDRVTQSGTVQVVQDTLGGLQRQKDKFTRQRLQIVEHYFL